MGENLKEPAGARGRAQLDTLWPMGRPFAGAAVPLPARPQGPLEHRRQNQKYKIIIINRNRKCELQVSSPTFQTSSLLRAGDRIAACRCRSRSDVRRTRVDGKPSPKLTQSCFLVIRLASPAEGAQFLPRAMTVGAF